MQVTDAKSRRNTTVPACFSLQKVRSLFSETQPLSIDFDKITIGAHPRKRQGRLGTAGLDQFKILEKMINEEDQTLVDVRISDQMVVIKDEHDLAG